MTVKKILALLAIASLFAASLSSLAEARGHRSGRHHCRAGHHLDYGTNSCVRNG